MNKEDFINITNEKMTDTMEKLDEFLSNGFDVTCIKITFELSKNEDGEKEVIELTRSIDDIKISKKENGKIDIYSGFTDLLNSSIDKLMNLEEFISFMNKFDRYARYLFDDYTIKWVPLNPDIYDSTIIQNFVSYINEILGKFTLIGPHGSGRCHIIFTTHDLMNHFKADFKLILTKSIKEM